MFDENRRYGVEIECGRANKYDIAEELSDYGIYCEVEGYNHRLRDHWKIVSDASLTMPNSFELVSPPLKGIESLQQVQIVSSVLKGQNAKVDKNCGIHVHHEAKWFRDNHFQKLYTLYRRGERAIDSIVSPSRRNGTYCRSLSGLPSTSDALPHLRQSRYYKINFQSYTRHGTIEFRHHQGTIESKKIINWILFTQRMMSRSRNKTPISTSTELIQQRYFYTFHMLLRVLGIEYHFRKNNPIALDLVNHLNSRRVKFGYDTVNLEGVSA
jgi:hypothetical protein